MATSRFSFVSRARFRPSNGHDYNGAWSFQQCVVDAWLIPIAPPQGTGQGSETILWQVNRSGKNHVSGLGIV